MMRVCVLAATALFTTTFGTVESTSSSSSSGEPQHVRQRRRTATTDCPVPQFVGDWQSLPNYPLRVGEAQGGVIDGELVVTGGFLPGFQSVAVQTYALTQNNNQWVPQDNFPLPEGITHAAFAIHDTDMYFCGGYLGGHPGQAVKDCFVYHHRNPRGQQWERLPDLPAPRAGGGMVYNEYYQFLLFAGGAVRPNVGKAHAVDYESSWMFAPTTPEYGWHSMDDIPFLGNHLSYVTTGHGKESRHFMMGGQDGENEKNGNIDTLVEYIAIQNEWHPKANLPEPRGHASSSTVPYGCGFIIAGGAVNGGATKRRTPDVSYYDPELDRWTSLGNLTEALKTPVCGIHGDWLYCSTGYTKNTHRRRLRL